MADKKDPMTEVRYRWLQVPPIYCDAFSVRAFGEERIVRMAFGEHVGKEYSPFYRASIAMPIADVKQLIKALAATIAEEEKDLAEESAKTDADTDTSPLLLHIRFPVSGRATGSAAPVSLQRLVCDTGTFIHGQVPRDEGPYGLSHHLGSIGLMVRIAEIFKHFNYFLTKIRAKTILELNGH